MNLVAQIFCSISVGYGNGRHLRYLSPGNAEQAIKMNIISGAFGVLAFCIPKIAVALLLARLLALERSSTIILLFLTISLMVFAIVDLIMLFTQCQPASALWDPKSAAIASCWDPSVIIKYGWFVGGSCFGENEWYSADEIAYSAFCDVALAIYPIPVILKLQMRVKRKLAICIILSLGLL